MAAGYRHLMAVLILLSTTMAYLTRVNLSTAMVDMVSRKGMGRRHQTAERFHWDQKSQGVVLGGFFYGYFFFQMFNGRMADSIGPRLLCAFGLFGSGLVNVLTPVLAHNYVVLVASRVLLGALQAAVFPCCYALASMWIPDQERSTVNSMAFIGSDIGMLIASAATGYLCRHGFAGGWPSAFYVPGAVVLAFSVLYFVLVRDDPKDHWLVSERERRHILAHIDRKPKSDRPPVPWRRIAADRTVWAAAFAHFSMVWTLQVYSLKLPDYMDRVVGLPLEKNGLFSSVIYGCEGVSLLVGGLLADALIRRQRLSKTTIRKLFMSISTFGSAIFTIMVPWTGQNASLFLGAMAMTMLMIGQQAGGLVPLASDLSGEFSATVFAIFNTVGMTNGFLCPYLIGWLLDLDSQNVARQWSIVLYFTAGLRIAGGIVFVLFVSAERRNWNVDRSQQEQADSANPPIFLVDVPCTDL